MKSVQIFDTDYKVYCWLEAKNITWLRKNLDGSTTKNYVWASGKASYGKVRLWFLKDLKSYGRICGQELGKFKGLNHERYADEADLYLKAKVTVKEYSGFEGYLSILTLTLIPGVDPFAITMEFEIYDSTFEKILWSKKINRDLLQYESLFPNPINYAIILWYKVFYHQSSLSRDEIIGRMYHDLLVDFTYYLKEHPLKLNSKAK